MTDKHIFQAQKREVVGKKVSQLRKQGIGVGTVSTPEGSSLSLQFDAGLATKLVSSVGESTLIYLKIDGEKNERPSLIEEVQHNPITEELYHLSFRQVSLKEKVSAAIPVEVVGVVDIADATMVVTMQEVEVEALPTDLPEKFVVDVASLTEVGQMVSLADLVYDRSKVLIKLGEDQDLATTPVVMIQAVKEEVEEAEEAPVSETKDAASAEGETPAATAAEATPATESTPGK